MIRSEAVTLVMQRLGKRTGLEADIIVELQQAQNDLELGEFLPWFLKKALSGLVTVTSVRAVTLPVDFLRETEEKWWLTTATGVQRLMKGSYDELYERELFSPDHVNSYYYSVVGTSLYLSPIPDFIGALSGFYLGKDTLLSTDATENEWLKWAPGLLIAKAGMRMAKTLRDAEAFSLFKEEYIESYARLVAADTAREQASFNAVMGG